MECFAGTDRVQVLMEPEEQHVMNQFESDAKAATE